MRQCLRAVEIVVLPSPEAVCIRAAEILAELLAAKPESVLGLPAGNTPRPVYAELVRRHREAGLSFAGATGFSLDEYVGLRHGHPASFEAYLEQAFYRQVDLPLARANVPDVFVEDLNASGARYEAAIAAAGGFDVVMLGIGSNGHIAFNEPGSSFDSHTRVVTLTNETRLANQPAFGTDQVPDRALTVGIATILSSRRCLLIAYGESKAEAIARSAEGPPNPALPASALQLHRDTTVIVDEAAASRLTRGRG
jgi:glucosamine-6-phosphate deaminase